jgi:hypothetical protein
VIIPKERKIRLGILLFLGHVKENKLSGLLIDAPLIPLLSLIAFEKLLKVFCASTICDTGHGYNISEPGGTLREGLSGGRLLFLNLVVTEVRRLNCPLGAGR